MEYKASVILSLPNLTFNSKSIVRKNHKTRIQSTEMKFLCGVARCTHKENHWNTDIIKKMESFKLKYKNTELQNNWL